MWTYVRDGTLHVAKKRTSEQVPKLVGNRELQFFLPWVMLLLLRLTKSLADVQNVMNNILTKDIPGYDSCAGIIQHPDFSGSPIITFILCILTYIMDLNHKHID